MSSFAALDWITIVAGLGMVVLVLLARVITRGVPPPNAFRRSRNELDQIRAARELDRQSYLRRREEPRTK